MWLLRLPWPKCYFMRRFVFLRWTTPDKNMLPTTLMDFQKYFGNYNAPKRLLAVEALSRRSTKFAGSSSSPAKPSVSSAKFLICCYRRRFWPGKNNRTQSYSGSIPQKFWPQWLLRNISNDAMSVSTLETWASVWSAVNMTRALKCSVAPAPAQA